MKFSSDVDENREEQGLKHFFGSLLGRGHRLDLVEAGVDAGHVGEEPDEPLQAEDRGQEDAHFGRVRAGWNMGRSGEVEHLLLTKTESRFAFFHFIEKYGPF